MLKVAGTLTVEQVWRVLAKATFAVLSHVTPAGEPRSSGVVYTVADRRMYVVVAPDSWKARHIRVDPDVAVTVPVRRGVGVSLGQMRDPAVARDRVPVD